MTKRVTFGILALLCIAGSTFAAGLPPGKWWRRPDVVQKLTLTDEQQQRLDAIFRNAADELIDMRAEVEKANVAVRSELDQSQISRQALQRASERLGAARSRLFTRELMMLADMRAVLSDVQWTRLRAELDRLNAPPPGMNRPGMQPRQGPRPRPGMRPGSPAPPPPGE